MNQLSAKELLSSFIAGNLNGITFENAPRQDAKGTSNTQTGFDFILKETFKVKEKVEKNDDFKPKRSKEENFSPAIQNKRNIVKQNNKILEIDKDIKTKDKLAENKDFQKDITTVNKSEGNEKDITSVEKNKVSETENQVYKEEKPVAVEESKECKAESTEIEEINQLMMFLSTVMNIDTKELEAMLEKEGINLNAEIKNLDSGKIIDVIEKNLNQQQNGIITLDKEVGKEIKEIIDNVLKNLKNQSEKTLNEEIPTVEIEDLNDYKDSKDQLTALENKAVGIKEKIFQNVENNTGNVVEEAVDGVSKEAEKFDFEKTSKNTQSIREIENSKENQIQTESQKNDTREKFQITPMVNQKENSNNNVNMQMVKDALAEKANENSKVTEVKETGTVSNNDVQQTKVNLTPNIQKSEKPSNLFNEALVKQLVDKAKITLSNNKNEMTMVLKPEHLGKLSLKISTENGMVVAKIVADNEQVKAILESNVNTLKESLENQGIKLSGLSISLSNNKQDGKEEAQNGENGEKRGFGYMNKNSIKSQVKQGFGGGLIDSQVINKYYGEKDNSINLTA